MARQKPRGTIVSAIQMQAVSCGSCPNTKTGAKVNYEPAQSRSPFILIAAADIPKHALILDLEL